MKQRVLQNGRLLASLESALAKRYDMRPLWEEADPQGFLARHGSEFAGYVCSARNGPMPP